MAPSAASSPATFSPPATTSSPPAADLPDLIRYGQARCGGFGVPPTTGHVVVGNARLLHAPSGLGGRPSMAVLPILSGVQKALSDSPEIAERVARSVVYVGASRVLTQILSTFSSLLLAR